MQEVMPPGFYNMDCMEGMKQFPDKFFDLAIVDPPYGTGGGYSQAKRDLESGLIDTENKVGGYSLPEKKRQETRRDMGLRELAERGRRNSEKNH